MEYSDSVTKRKQIIGGLINDARATQMSCQATIVMFDPVADKQLYDKLQFDNPNAHCFVIAQIGVDSSITFRSERLKNPFMHAIFEKIDSIQPGQKLRALFQNLKATELCGKQIQIPTADGVYFMHASYLKPWALALSQTLEFTARQNGQVTEFFANAVNEGELSDFGNLFENTLLCDSNKANLC